MVHSRRVGTPHRRFPLYTWLRLLKHLSERKTLMHTQKISGAETPRTRQRHPLINHNFALLWSGQTVSMLGDYVFNTTLIVWVGIVLAQGQSWTPLAVSGLALASSLPALLLTPVA